MGPTSDQLQQQIGEVRSDMESRILELRAIGRRRVRTARRVALVAIGVGLAAAGVVVVWRLARPPTARERLQRLLPAGAVKDLRRMRETLELKELAIRNGIAVGMLVVAGMLVLLGVFVMVPLVVVTWRPDHLRWALYFLGAYLVVGVLLAITGRLLLRLEPPRRTLEALKETREWALRQISSNSR